MLERLECCGALSSSQTRSVSAGMSTLMVNFLLTIAMCSECSRQVHRYQSQLFLPGLHLAVDRPVVVSGILAVYLQRLRLFCGERTKLLSVLRNQRTSARCGILLLAWQQGCYLFKMNVIQLRCI